MLLRDRIGSVLGALLKHLGFLSEDRYFGHAFTHHALPPSNLGMSEPTPRVTHAQILATNCESAPAATRQQPSRCCRIFVSASP
jgi:hypothetical protein